MEEMKPPEHWQGVWKRVVVVGGGVAGSLVAKSLQFHADVTLIVPISDVNKSEYSIEWGELVPGREINKTIMIAHTEELVEDIVKVGVQNGLDTHFIEHQPWISAKGNEVVPLL